MESVSLILPVLSISWSTSYGLGSSLTTLTSTLLLLLSLVKAYKYISRGDFSGWRRKEGGRREREGMTKEKQLIGRRGEL